MQVRIIVLSQRKQSLSLVLTQHQSIQLVTMQMEGQVHHRVRQRHMARHCIYQVPHQPERDMISSDGQRTAVQQVQLINPAAVIRIILLQHYMPFGRLKHIRLATMQMEGQVHHRVRQKHMARHCIYQVPHQPERDMISSDGQQTAVQQVPLINLAAVIRVILLLRCMLFGSKFRFHIL